ncbi:peptide chain release factor-like protein [Gimesia sp.]|uniref:peptide chain release factor family protein n=1 Tax=Gimesia sp. TaxID=2024833 RepID=UPI000C561EDA|nr:peptide chain release factor-like protein [Gimesia sp.]MAX36569.1 peptide chain release factor-like protein [Gimesia sp.]HAH49033.1 peptide chain release factor-like protein [Planctomycetaceae bacterium]HBL47969.1 peptide chain release factor-like protein [Planctomycetaceae bacterium]|tara:strand:+ start:9223 stop:9762 length:540 start_codon:yes stop_codon:yes gene_type:complete
MLAAINSERNLSENVHPACANLDALLKDCQIEHVRRSGPGGQHRNKVETGVVIKHLPTKITGEASERRQQGRNRSIALFRLRVNLALGYRNSEIQESPSALWQRRLMNGTLKVNSEHDEFPALLAEALDTVTYFQFDVKAASQFLNCSSSQLIKFLKKEPRAFATINQRRLESGLHLLK